jgi:hypothetical protein
MRVSLYLFGYRVLVIDVSDTSTSTYLKQPEKLEAKKLFDRAIKAGSRYCMNAMTQ